MSNNTNRNNNTNPPGLDALAALCNSLGASAGQDSRHPAAAAQALASLASSQSSNQAQAPGGPSSSPYGLQSLYAQQVQQFTAAQTQHQKQEQQQQQQQQHAQSHTLLKSLPTELLQAYLASTASQSIPPALLNNAPQAPQPPQQLQQQQQQLYAQAQAIAAQLLAASAQAKLEVQRPPSAPNNISSVLQGDVMGALARSGSANNGGTVANGPDSGLLNQIQAEAAAKAIDASAKVAAAEPNPSASLKTESPPEKLPSNHPKKRLKSQAAADSSQVKQPIQVASAAKGQPDTDDKKLAKRAANRLSAHLSRKRKKMYIDDVTTENVDLRRKVQILQSIPDLVVVFDSSGCISFVSQSVPAFFDMQASEIEGASFWNFLTEDSVNLIKTAFMDALAEKRNPEDDSTLLCHGESLLIKLVDKDGNEPSVVSFKGVVHFTDNAPECISSMRPVAMNSVSSSPQGFNDAQFQEATRKLLPTNGNPHDISDVESRKATRSNDSSGSSSD